MSKVHKKVFMCEEEDKTSDDALERKLALLGEFIEPSALDIKPVFIQNMMVISLAQGELANINSFKAPADKLQVRSVISLLIKMVY